MIDFIIRLYYETQRHLPATEIHVNHFTYSIIQREHAQNTIMPLETLFGIPIKIINEIEHEIKIIVK